MNDLAWLASHFWKKKTKTKQPKKVPQKLLKSDRFPRLLQGGNPAGSKEHGNVFLSVSCWAQPQDEFSFWKNLAAYPGYLSVYPIGFCQPIAESLGCADNCFKNK